MAIISIADLIPIASETALKSESPIESRMMSGLMRTKKFTLVRAGDKPEGEGLFVLQQMKLGPYRADIVIKGVGYKSAIRVWPPNKSVYICVECDGKEFHTSPEQKADDKERDDYFMSKGIKTFRYTGGEIYKFADQIALDLAAYLHGEIFRP